MNSKTLLSPVSVQVTGLWQVYFATERHFWEQEFTILFRLGFCRQYLGSRGCHFSKRESLFYSPLRDISLETFFCSLVESVIYHVPICCVSGTVSGPQVSASACFLLHSPHFPRGLARQRHLWSSDCVLLCAWLSPSLKQGQEYLTYFSLFRSTENQTVGLNQTQGLVVSKVGVCKPAANAKPACFRPPASLSGRLQHKGVPSCRAEECSLQLFSDSFMLPPTSDFTSPAPEGRRSSSLGICSA